jgi:hypothetical protein
MDNLIADFHIHSRFSHDSLMSPEQIVKRAKITGLSAIAVTDHNTIRGAFQAQKVAKGCHIQVIVGSEIKTTGGDIIGLLLNEEISSTEWVDVIQDIRSQGGWVVLPHPYRGHENPEQIAKYTDFVEVWNSRCAVEENKRALDLALSTGKKGIYGSDAHCPSEIGLVRIQVDPTSFEVQQVLSSSSTSSLNIHKSQVISLVRYRKFGTLIRAGAGFLWKKVD